MDTLQLTPRTSRYGCGIYEAGDTDRCYVKLFVTDRGFVLPVNHRIINEEDLMEVYVQGRLEGHRDTDRILDFLAEELMESGAEIGEMIEERRAKRAKEVDIEDGFGI